MTQASLVVRNAVLLTVSDARPDPFPGWLAADAGGRLVAVEPGEPPSGFDGAAIVDADGAFVAPGFLSAHSHLFTSGSRGLGMDQALYGWVDAMTRYTRHADAEDIYWCALHGALDFLGNGITTAYDFTDSRLPLRMDARGQRVMAGPLRSFEHAGAQIRAKVDAGLRFINSVMLNDELGEEEEVLARFAETKAYGESFEATGLYLGTAISGSVQWSTNPSCARVEAEAMRRFGVLNQPHFLETAQELELRRSKWGLYRDAGAFGPKLVFGHFVQATDEMIAEAAAAAAAWSGNRRRTAAWPPVSPTYAPAWTRGCRSASGSTTSLAPTYPIRGRTCASASTPSAPTRRARRRWAWPRCCGCIRSAPRRCWESRIASGAWRSANMPIS